jgi:hypothetical protein
MDSFVFWIVLWLIPTCSLNKIKLTLSMVSSVRHATIRCVFNHNLPQFDFNGPDGLAVHISAYAAAAAFVACCVSL